MLMRAGLLVATFACLFAAVASWRAGYPSEVAILRGLVVWMVFVVLGYLAELVVVSTPAPVHPVRRVSPPPSIPDVKSDTRDEAA